MGGIMKRKKQASLCMLYNDENTVDASVWLDLGGLGWSQLLLFLVLVLELGLLALVSFIQKTMKCVEQ